jgi:hypothetical protein
VDWLGEYAGRVPGTDTILSRLEGACNQVSGKSEEVHKGLTPGLDRERVARRTPTANGADAGAGRSPSVRACDARLRVGRCQRSGVERGERRRGARGVDPDASVDDERALGRGDDRVEVELCDGGMRGHERADAHYEVAQ